MIAAQSSNFGLINSELIVLSRLMGTMADDGHLPKFLIKSHPNIRPRLMPFAPGHHFKYHDLWDGLCGFIGCGYVVKYS
jgi:hypothetical protein